MCFFFFRTIPPNGIRDGVRWRTDDEDFNTKSVKRARLEFSPTNEKETKKTNNVTSLKTVDMELTSAESLALLHTPYVTSVVKQKQSKETMTPHSILKVIHYLCLLFAMLTLSKFTLAVCMTTFNTHDN